MSGDWADKVADELFPANVTYPSRISVANKRSAVVMRLRLARRAGYDAAIADIREAIKTEPVSALTPRGD